MYQGNTVLWTCIDALYANIGVTLLSKAFGRLKCAQFMVGAGVLAQHNNHTWAGVRSLKAGRLQCRQLVPWCPVPTLLE